MGDLDGRRPVVVGYDGSPGEFLNERPQGAVNEVARGAVLLVLGRRGVGSVPAMRLGPVTQSALLAAPCPVAVTPP